MEHVGEPRSEKLLRLYDKALETGALTGIVVTRMLLNALPASVKGKGAWTPLHFDDRRRGRRLHVDRAVTCSPEGREQKRARLINISKGGMYVETDTPVDVGQEMSFNLSGRNLGPIMRVRGRVARRSDKGMAIQFT
ncbi:MAG: PilZ domain-containing protein [Syntrophaceae bacterium]